MVPFFIPHSFPLHFFLPASFGKGGGNLQGRDLVQENSAVLKAGGLFVTEIRSLTLLQPSNDVSLVI